MTEIEKVLEELMGRVRLEDRGVRDWVPESIAALRAALAKPPERGEYARGWRAGAEAAANEAWNTVAAHACDTIPLSLADELATALRSLSPPEEKKP